jgi:hypothetical protein
MNRLGRPTTTDATSAPTNPTSWTTGRKSSQAFSTTIEKWIEELKLLRAKAKLPAMTPEELTMKPQQTNIASLCEPHRSDASCCAPTLGRKACGPARSLDDQVNEIAKHAQREI